ncbi:MAG: AraC family transcriptional regulator [Vicinamibacterales bacterium]
MDVLSEVLATVTLRGAFYFNGEFTAPWAVRTPPSTVLAPHIGPGDGHVIIFHLVTDGRGVAGLEGGALVPFEAGDVIVFPHGDAHVVGSGAGSQAVDYEGELHRILDQGLRTTRAGGGGAVTRFVCGYLSCDPRLSRTFLAGLPPMLKVHVRQDGSGQWLEQAIRNSVADGQAASAGGEAVLARLAEALFIETLRRHVAALPAEHRSWLAGARDPEVGRALALMHAGPARPWTLARLASAAGVSRSVLAERFRLLLGEPPMTYLSRWRLQLGAQLLQATSRRVADIAAEVGYDSEAGFNRAFRREHGTPPARFRNTFRKASARLRAPARRSRESRA